MWIKTDVGKLVNLDHYQDIKIVEESFTKWVVRGYTDTISSDIAICESAVEAATIRDNIYCAISSECKITNVEYLRK